MTQNKSRIADGAWNLSLSFQPSALLLAIAISLRVVIWRGLLGFTSYCVLDICLPLFATLKTLKLSCISVLRNGNGEYP